MKFIWTESKAKYFCSIAGGPIRVIFFSELPIRLFYLILACIFRNLKRFVERSIVDFLSILVIRFIPSSSSWPPLDPPKGKPPKLEKKLIWSKNYNQVKNIYNPFTIFKGKSSRSDKIKGICTYKFYARIDFWSLRNHSSIKLNGTSEKLILLIINFVVNWKLVLIN